MNGMRAGAASVYYTFSRPVAWLTGHDGYASEVYNSSWAASGILGTTTQTVTNWVAGGAAVAGSASQVPADSAAVARSSHAPTLGEIRT